LGAEPSLQWRDAVVAGCPVGDLDQGDRVVGVTEVAHLLRQAGDDLRAPAELAGFAGRGQAVGPVPLGGAVQLRVVAHPSDELGQVGCHRVELAANLAVLPGLQQLGDALELGDGRAAEQATPVRGGSSW
jgi:hypothetical protein